MTVIRGHGADATNTFTSCFYSLDSLYSFFTAVILKA